MILLKTIPFCLFIILTFEQTFVTIYSAETTTSQISSDPAMDLATDFEWSCGSNSIYIPTTNICEDIICSPLLKNIDDLTCISECQTNAFSNLTGYCYPCHSTYATCSGEGYNECITCVANLFLLNSICLNFCPPYYYSNIQACFQDNCESGFYLEVSGTCAACNSSCQTCNGPSNQNCLLCIDKTLLLNAGVCVSNCLSGFYNNSQINCLPCNSNCQNCSGPNDNQCLSCFNSNYFIINLSKCAEECPIGYMSDNSTMKCIKCQENCAECSDQNTCMICNLNYTLIISKCKYMKEIKGIFYEENNPFAFIVNIPQNWIYFFSNYETFLKKIHVENLEISDYSYISSYNQSDSQNIHLVLKYYKIFNKNQTSLKIWLLAEDKYSDNSNYFFINQTITISLNSLTLLCKEDEYLNQSIFIYKRKILNYFFV